VSAKIKEQDWLNWDDLILLLKAFKNDLSELLKIWLNDELYKDIMLSCCSKLSK